MHVQRFGPGRPKFQRENFSVSATSISWREVLRTPSRVLSATGMKAASVMKTIFAVSPNPNQIEISGIQASRAICFDHACWYPLQ